MRKRIFIYMIMACMFCLAINWPTSEKGQAQETQQISMKVSEAIEEQAQEKEVDELIMQPDPLPWEDIPLSGDEQIMMSEMCAENNLSYAFALAILESESMYNPEAIGDEGRSIGYYQINMVNWPRMKEDYGLDPKNQIDNLVCGIYILAELFEKYDDPYLVIECYKCGESRGLELYNQGIYKTDQFDCEEICNRSEEIERSHGL